MIGQVHTKPTGEQVAEARVRLTWRYPEVPGLVVFELHNVLADIRTILAELDAVTAERDQAIRELGVLGQQLGRERHEEFWRQRDPN